MQRLPTETYDQMESKQRFEKEGVGGEREAWPMRIGPSRALRLYDLLRRRSLIIRAFHFLLFTSFDFVSAPSAVSSSFSRLRFRFALDFRFCPPSYRLDGRETGRDRCTRNAAAPKFQKPHDRPHPFSIATHGLDILSFKSCPLKKPIIERRRAATDHSGPLLPGCRR